MRRKREVVRSGCCLRSWPGGLLTWKNTVCDGGLTPGSIILMGVVRKENGRHFLWSGALCCFHPYAIELCLVKFGHHINGEMQIYSTGQTCLVDPGLHGCD